MTALRFCGIISIFTVVSFKSDHVGTILFSFIKLCIFSTFMEENLDNVLVKWLFLIM